MPVTFGFVVGFACACAAFFVPALLVFGFDAEAIAAFASGPDGYRPDRNETFVCEGSESRVFTAPPAGASAVSAGCRFAPTRGAKQRAEALRNYFKLAPALRLAPPWHPELADGSLDAARYARNRATARQVFQLYSDAIGSDEWGALVSDFYKKHPNTGDETPEGEALWNQLSAKQDALAKDLMGERLDALRADSEHDPEAVDAAVAGLFDQTLSDETTLRRLALFGPAQGDGARKPDDTGALKPFTTGLVVVDDDELNIITAFFPDLAHESRNLLEHVCTLGCEKIEYGYLGEGFFGQ